MKPAKTHKLNCNIFAAAKKWFQLPTVFARYNREQLGKYTGKLVVTTDPGIRVWYGMVWWYTRKMAKPVKGHHFQHYKHIYNQIISLLFPYVSLLFPYFSPMVPYNFACFSPIVPGETWRNHILSVENLLNISKLKKTWPVQNFLMMCLHHSKCQTVRT